MRILLAEDEPDLGTAIKWALKQEKYIVDWAKDGEEAWVYLESQWLEYSVAILDWLLPKTMGIDLCRRLRRQHNPLPILMLTAKDRTADKIAGLDAGADDYLVKPFEVEELLARVRALQRRPPKSPVLQLRLGKILLDYTSRTVYCQDDHGIFQSITLTNKGFQLLEYFMRHSRHLIDADQLLYQLWEADKEASRNVVAAQIRLLRRKLAEQGCHDFIETVSRMGYRVNPRYVE